MFVLLATRHPPNFVDHLSATREDFGNSFTLCLAEEGGYMTLGGMNTEQHHSDQKIKYVPLVSGDQYYVELTNVFVNIILSHGFLSRSYVS